MKTILEKRVAKLEEKKSALIKKSDTCEDVAELRSMMNEIKDINEELAELRADIKKIEENEERTVPANATLVNGQTVASFSTEQRDENPTASLEYRQAFKNYIQNGVAIPAELRAGETITSGDVGPAIPYTVMNEVINTVRKRYGNLYNKVRKMTVKGGVEFPIGALKASFKWIAEGTVSPRQKLDKLGKVSFSYHQAEIKISQSFLTAILSLDAFEMKIAEVIAVAYLQAMDEAIVNGTGDGMPLGIVNDPRVTNVVEMTATDMSDWSAWRKNFFAKLPLGYRAGEFIFSMSTVDSYLETMADSNNNPVFRQATGLEVNDGDAQNPNGTFFGRAISLVEPDIVADFDTAESGDVIGIYWQPEEYAINENFGFTMLRYRDEDANEIVDKAYTVVDGKALNPTGFYLIKKK